jgi:hypothetical protein
MRRFSILLGLAVALATPLANAEEALDPERHEAAGFPIIGGNTDIGILFGFAGTLTRFHDTLNPYLWNIDLVLSSSVKNDANGTRLIQHNYVLRLDSPFLFDRKLRLDTRGSFQRTVNAGYYGIGNASNAPPSTLGRRYQYLQEEGRVRTIGRYRTGKPVDLAFGAILRAESPTVYRGSRLADDRVAGTQSTALGGAALGIVIDTRDSEFVTHRGIFYEIGAGYTVGTDGSARYANSSAVLCHYAPLVGPFFFAQRFIASFEAGRVPFYDLQQGGTFEPTYLLGSEGGIRGVPQGRYAGLIKTITNIEIRSAFPRFTLFKQRLRLGTTTFFDAGRTWADYKRDPRDGHMIGLKYGIGGGMFLQWGEAAIFRIEAAYSPDATAENPNFPVGIYVADGFVF